MCVKNPPFSFAQLASTFDRLTKTETVPITTDNWISGLLTVPSWAEFVTTAAFSGHAK